MNDLIPIVNPGEPLTMSSVEIAELCEKQHGNVLRDIRKMFDDLGGDALKFESIYTDSAYRKKRCYRLPKDLTLTLIAGYRVDIRKKIIDRWLQLEQQVHGAPSPNQQVNVRDPQQLAQLTLQLTAYVGELEYRAQYAEAKVEQMLPDVKAYERIAVADGSHCIRDTAKTLQVREKDLIGWLREHQWIYSRPGNTRAVGYSDAINRGYLEHKVTTITKSDGSELQVSQVRVTPKGLNVLAKKFGVPLATANTLTPHPQIT